MSIIFKYIFLFSVIFTVKCNTTFAQEHTYAVTVAGKEIGEITTSLAESGDTQTYQIISDVNFKVLWKSYHRRTTALVTYKNKGLDTSFSDVHMNNDMEDSAAISLDQNKYQCFRYPDDNFVLNDSEIPFTTAKLYFEEPVGIEKIYSERFLEYCPVEMEGDHKYKLYLPNGKVNYYTYADASLIEAFIDRTWFNLKFRRK